MDAAGKLVKLRGAVRAVQFTHALAKVPRIDVTEQLADLNEVSSPVWIRTVFLLPFLWAAVDPLRFIEIHPTPFAEPRSAASYRDTSYFVSLLFALMTIFATVLTHIFEAGRRHKLPRESAKVSPKVEDMYATHPSYLQSEQHAAHVTPERGRDAAKPPNLPSEQPATSGTPQSDRDAANPRTSSVGARCSEYFTWRLDAKDMRIWTSFDAIEALVHGTLLALAMHSDVVDRYPKIAGAFALGYVLPIVGAFIMKRIMYGVTEAQGRHMAGWVTNTAVLVCKTVAFNLLLLLGYVISSTAYPYDLDTSALNQWLQEGNHSSLRCDNEAVFWATFELPYTVRVGVDRTIECEEPLCGYRDWTALCQAVRNVGVHFTSSYVMMGTLLCSLFLVIIFFVLGGSDRISRKKDGSLDLQRLLDKHILVILVCSGVMAILTLANAARLMVTTPLLLFAATPGFEAEPLAMLGEAKWNNIVYVVALPGPLVFGAVAILLLPIDTLSKFMERRRDRMKSYFLSYKQNDNNDAAVQMLAYQLKERGVKKVWLDKLAEDRSQAGMIDGVKESDIFVAVISPGYFASKFCCLELDTALKRGKPIVLVWNQSKDKVQTALDWIPKELKFLMGKELLPIMEDIQMAAACTKRIMSQKLRSFELTGDLEWLQKSEPDAFQVKQGVSTQNLARDVDIAPHYDIGQLESLKSQLEALEKALERPLALGVFDRLVAEAEDGHE